MPRGSWRKSLSLHLGHYAYYPGSKGEEKHCGVKLAAEHIGQGDVCYRVLRRSQTVQRTACLKTMSR